MKAMILAAGFGKRMQPLTLKTPKPLLEVAGKPLVVYHLERLAAAGYKEIVINVSYLAQQIINRLGDGSEWGLSIEYSTELSPLETAGGIRHALPLLGDEPFLLVNGDVWCDFDFRFDVDPMVEKADSQVMAHLILVPNPSFNPEGDFNIDSETQRVISSNGPYTYAGISVIRPSLLTQVLTDEDRLGKLFQACLSSQFFTGRVFQGHWVDVGTPERLEQLNREVSGKT